MNPTDTFDAGPIINKARELLSSNEGKLSSESLEEVDRAINLLYAKFNELGDYQALETCGIIGYAIAKGSKNASKKKPKLKRWSSEPPPPITELPTESERAGAIGILKSFKAPWVASYALKNAGKFDGHKKLSTSLLKWIETGSTCSADTLHGFSSFLTEIGTTNISQIDAIFKQYPSLFEAPINCETDIHGAAFSCAMRIALDVFTANPERFGKYNPVETLISSCEKSSGLEPHILFNPEVQNALCVALKSISKPSKTTTNAVFKIGHRLLSLALWHVKLYGMDDSAEILGVLDSIDNDLFLTSNAKKSKSYSGLLAKSESLKAQRTSTTDIYTLVSSLLLAWDDLLQFVSLDKNTDEITALLQSISSSLGLARFGTKDQIISFDPFRHFIDADPTTNVIVAIPGITVIRADGSERVLVKAVVNPA